MKLTYLSYLIFPFFCVGAFAMEMVPEHPDLETYYRIEIASSAKRLASEARVHRSTKFTVKDGKNVPLTQQERQANNEIANQKLAGVKDLDEKISRHHDLPLGVWKQFTTGEPMAELDARNASHPIFMALELRLYRLALLLLQRGVIMPIISVDKFERYKQQAQDMDTTNESKENAAIFEILEETIQVNFIPSIAKNYTGTTLPDILTPALDTLTNMLQRMREDVTETLHKARTDAANKREEITQKYASLQLPLQTEQKRLDDEKIVDGFWSSPRKKLSAEFTSLSDKEKLELKAIDDEFVRLQISLEEKLRVNIRAKTMERDQELAALLKQTMDEVMNAVKKAPDLHMRPLGNAQALEHPVTVLLANGLVRSAVTLSHYGLQLKTLEQASAALTVLNSSNEETEALLSNGTIDTTKLCILAWEKFGYGTKKEASAMVQEIQSSSLMWSLACNFYSGISSLFSVVRMGWWSSQPAEESTAQASAQKGNDELAQLEELNAQFETNEMAQGIFFGPYRCFLN